MPLEQQALHFPESLWIGPEVSGAPRA
jgi:hypothetical protein